MYVITKITTVTYCRKSKMAASKMAAWRLRWIYLNYNPNWESGVLSFRA